MRLYDTNTETEYSIPALFTEWETFRKEDPVNHAERFIIELFEILMATVNRRNDCEIVGPTPSELDRIIRKIRREIEKNDYR